MSDRSAQGGGHADGHSATRLGVKGPRRDCVKNLSSLLIYEMNFQESLAQVAVALEEAKTATREIEGCLAFERLA